MNNYVESQYFDEISSLVPGIGCQTEEFVDVFAGCDCINNCSATNACSCLLYNQDIYENNDSIKDSALNLPILECGTACACSKNLKQCSNRCIQYGPKLPLQIFDTNGKGYGLRCKVPIHKGRFVAEYAGEVIGETEVEKRKRENHINNYIFTVKEMFTSGKKISYIDARHCGNIARFINHSCEPNLNIVLVRLGTPVVHVALFARRYVEKFEELTYDYGVNYFCGGDENVKQLYKCLCGSASCKGYLPSSVSATA